MRAAHGDAGLPPVAIEVLTAAGLAGDSDAVATLVELQEVGWLREHYRRALVRIAKARGHLRESAR